MSIERASPASRPHRLPWVTKEPFDSKDESAPDFTIDAAIVGRHIATLVTRTVRPGRVGEIEKCTDSVDTKPDSGRGGSEQSVWASSRPHLTRIGELWGDLPELFAARQ